MSKIDDFRAKYPGVYDDMSDAEIAEGLYQKSYSDMPREEFDAAMGLDQYDETSTMQNIFDMIDPKTGKSIFYGNTPDPGPTEDYRRIARDSITRGFGDKGLGPEAQAKTAASRERTPGYIETPLDIASSMISSPYTVGSKMAAAGYGGIEGALDAYGHQDSWVPDPYKIGAGALKGSGAGALGAKVGEWGSGLWNKAFGKASDEPFKSSDDLAAEATRREELGYPKFAEDYRGRAARVKEAEALQGKDRGEFNKMVSGMSLTPAERAAADAAGKAPGLAKRFVIKAGEYVPSKKVLGTAGLVEGILYGLPVKTLAAGAIAKGVSSASKKLAKPPKAEVDALLSIMRDPNGKGYRVDTTGADAARSLLAKFGMGAAK